MRHILCYGDSNTWGYTPGTGERHAPDVRWTGVLRRLLGEGWELGGKKHFMQDTLGFGIRTDSHIRTCCDELT